ncbi:MAG: aminoglycoside 6-adenylyltransferase [Candidatus Hodarchaeota archaeon]
MDQIIDKIKNWAYQTEDVIGIIIVGSHARKEKPADEWADLDLLLIVKNFEKYFVNTTWLSEIGNVKLTHLEKTLFGDKERRVLFQLGDDCSAWAVDFVLTGSDFIANIKEKNLNPETLAVLSPGYRVLVDKMGFAKSLPPIGRLKRRSAKKPSRDDFTNCANDFLFHIIWSAKKIQRGELWLAHQCLGGYLKQRCLLPMIEWFMLAQHEWNYDVWYSGRFIEEWIDPEVLAALKNALPKYHKQDMIESLLSLLDLFKLLARHTTAKLCCDYLDESHEWVTEWINKCFFKKNSEMKIKKETRPFQRKN